METELIRKSKEFAEEALSHLSTCYCYHNIKHTHQVVAAAEEVGKASGLSTEELETVIIAAWFHDTGYSENPATHESISAQNAVSKLQEWGVDDFRIQQVRQAILATRLPQQPQSLIDEVLCDADLHHLATDGCGNVAEELRKELKSTKNLDFSDAEWQKKNIDFMKNHHYFTQYGQVVLEKSKHKNVKKLKKMLKHLSEEGMNELNDLEKEGKDKEKNNRPDRGIESMFRIVSQNHTTLSSLADTKANIMITVNSIILSLLVSVLFRKLEEFPELLLPTMLLTVVCLVTTVFAILATRPNIGSGKFTDDDIKNRNTNLLFFGNFHGMELSKFDWAMRKMMQDSEYLYGSLIKDIYFNGKVLARKYHFLRLSYNIFMFGFVASILAFIAAMLMYYYPANKLPI